MKKLMIAAATAMTAMAPLTATNASALTPRGDYDRGDYDRGDRGDYDRGDRGDRGDRYDHDRRGDGRWDRDDRRGDRRGYRHGYRDWDRRAHNGYYWQNRWYYGPPPQAYYGHPGFRADYRAWRRGDRLPPYYRNSYYGVGDYGRYGLRAPPRGYHWVRDDRGGYLLVGIATGIILGSVLSDHYDRY